MKTRIITSVVISAAMLLAAPVFADEKVEWADVPPAVQKTITDHAAGGKIDEIEVAEDGKLIKIKDD